jgi:hypothetical protein
MAPLRLGSAAFTAGEKIYFAPGAYQPVTFGGRAVLAHELTHVLQQRHRRTTDSAEQGVTVLFEPELEAQAFDCGLRFARGERVNFSRPRVSAFEPAGSVIAQPLIINAGEDPFYAEFRKYNGWIVAKDVYIAFFEGGAMQTTLELSDDATRIKLGADENIYLQGHGSPGMVGNYPAHIIADFIAKFQFPSPWVGNIRAYCCSAGLGSAYNDSGAAELAAALSSKKITELFATKVTGAAGVAINCRTYAGGTRVLKNDAAAQKRVDDQIDKTRAPVDVAWKQWVEKNIAPFIPEGAHIPSGLAPLSTNTLWAAAYKASQFSKGFYEALEGSCKNDLIESGKDLTTKLIL